LPEDLLCEIAKILENLKIPYVISGGFAVAVWGKPRFTADIDIAVWLEKSSVRPLWKRLSFLDRNVYVNKESMEEAVIFKKEFNFIHSNTGVKVDFFILQDNEFDKLKIKRSVLKKIKGQKISFISPENLVLTKLIWYKKSLSSKQLEDIKSILKISKVDKEYLKKWSKKLSLLKFLNEVL